MTLRFANPWVLYLLWLAPLLGLWLCAVARRGEARLADFVSASMQAKLRPPSSRTRALWQCLLLSCAVLLALVALAGPQWGIRDEVVFQRGRDLIIALDVSRSMHANDVHPNRLERAKADLMDLVGELQGDRVGLIAFRHKAVVLCPLTTDYSYLVHSLDAADIDSAPPGGTDIGDAVIKALEAFDNKDSAHKAIVLISDGEDLTGGAMAAAQNARTNGIPIFTVGIGSRRGSRIPEQGDAAAWLTYQGSNVVTRLHDSTLESIARITGGAYQPIGIAGTTTTTLGALYRDYLKNVTDQDLEETLQRRHVERYQLFLLPAFLLMAACAFLSRGRLGAVTRGAQGQRATGNGQGGTRRGGVAVMVIVVATLGLAAPARSQTATNHPPPSPSPSSPGRAGARKAQTLYSAGKYREAAEAYMAAVRGSTGKSQHDFRYNAAVALFKAHDYETAAEIFEDIARSSGPHSAPASAALGAVLYERADLSGEPNVTNLNERAELLVRAAAAFKDAARAPDADDRSLRNLQIVLDRLPDAREQAKIAGLMALYGKESAPVLAMKMLETQRGLIAGMPDAFTDTTPSKIEQLESLAAAQRAAADMWIPLKRKILESFSQSQSATNTELAASLEQTIDGSRDAMLDSAARLRNLDPNAYRSAVTSEAITYGLWKNIAPFELILQEDMNRQTNSIMINTPGHKLPAAQYDAPDLHQAEALGLTKLFIERFSQAVPAGGTVQKQPPGEMMTEQDHAEQAGISAKTRAQILVLAEQAVAAQTKALELLKAPNPITALPIQNGSNVLLKEIEKLLPKQKQQQKEQPQQQESPPPDEPDPPEDQSPPDQNQPPPEEKNPPKPDQKPATPEDVKNLLEKALDREKEHEDELRRRNRVEMRVPFEQDW